MITGDYVMVKGESNPEFFQFLFSYQVPTGESYLFGQRYVSGEEVQIPPEISSNFPDNRKLAATTTGSFVSASDVCCKIKVGNGVIDSEYTIVGYLFSLDLI